MLTPIAENFSPLALYAKKVNDCYERLLDQNNGRINKNQIQTFLLKSLVMVVEWEKFLPEDIPGINSRNLSGQIRFALSPTPNFSIRKKSSYTLEKLNFLVFHREIREVECFNTKKTKGIFFSRRYPKVSVEQKIYSPYTHLCI